jgi:two-component system sensor kinase FixL
METSSQESAERIRAIVETAADGIITIDERGIVESINTAACRIFRYAAAEVIGRNVSMLMPSPDREKHDDYLANYLRTGHAKIIGIGREVMGQRKDGTAFPMDLSVGEVRLADRRLFTGVIRDITERKRAEEALRDSEQRMRAILETAVEGIITIDEHGTVESINPAACRIFGYEPDEVIGQNVKMLMPSPYRENHDTYLSNYLRSGQAKIIGIGREVVGLRKNGTQFPMDLAVGEVRLSGRRIFAGFVRDISERRELEQAAATAAEQERSRIARELHDGLCQQLGGLLFLMKGLGRDLEEVRSPHAETAWQLGNELATALSQTRHLAHELYAVPPEPDGLVEALSNLSERMGHEAETVFEFACDGTILVHNPAVASHLYRIAQESVHNALKHSGATRIEILLAEKSTMLELRVRDNGIGFSPTAASRGLGLRTMQQRASLIGGRVVVRTHEQGGTEVICSVPKDKTILADTNR